MLAGAALEGGIAHESENLLIRNRLNLPCMNTPWNALTGKPLSGMIRLRGMEVNIRGVIEVGDRGLQGFIDRDR